MTAFLNLLCGLDVDGRGVRTVDSEKFLCERNTDAWQGAYVKFKCSVTTPDGNKAAQQTPKLK